VAQLRKERSETIYVATKAGRRLDPHVAGGYNRANLTAFVERSLKNLNTEAIDLLQLHCPPTEVFTCLKLLVYWMILCNMESCVTMA
ncbi:MAG TPA: aldo/keto reductase, partial [Anaerolineales bacterium]|nr:aldo/keto reductase [Anaerolineales bacterium]